MQEAGGTSGSRTTRARGYGSPRSQGNDMENSKLASASSDNCRGALDLVLVGEGGRIVAGEAVIGELRIHGIAAGLAHGA